MLTDILSYCRPHASATETEFVHKYLGHLPADSFGNHIHRQGDSRTMFSCHTDTVHQEEGRQLVSLDSTGVITSSGSCLGADDGAGLWLMLEMIRAGVPGLYVFHRGEEVGGLGSSYIAEATPDLLNDIDRAIAFDRKGKDSLVTHQGGERTASDTFAWGLADAIGLPDMRPDSSGIFTDTANYAHLVSECTNVSVGYERAHSARESLDSAYLYDLRNALVTTQWETIPAHRDHTAPTVRHYLWEGDELMEMVEQYPDIARDLLEDAGVTVADFIEREDASENWSIYNDQ